jgi:hypothetical protein
VLEKPFTLSLEDEQAHMTNMQNLHTILGEWSRCLAAKDWDSSVLYAGEYGELKGVESIGDGELAAKLVAAGATLHHRLVDSLTAELKAALTLDGDSV